MEKWKNIKGYGGIYEISNYGRVKSFQRSLDGRILSAHTEKCNHTNYKAVTLCDDNNRTQKRVHRLVAEAFVDNPENKPNINHIDNNGENNNAENLEWCTQSENLQHSHNQGRMTEAVSKANKVQSSISKKKREDMIGRVYGKWIVLEAVKREYKGNITSKMLCRCECGKEKEVVLASLINGRSTQCTSCAGKRSGRKKNASIV